MTGIIFRVSYDKPGQRDYSCNNIVCCFFVTKELIVTSYCSFNKKKFVTQKPFKNTDYFILIGDYVINLEDEELFEFPDADITFIKLKRPYDIEIPNTNYLWVIGNVDVLLFDSTDIDKSSVVIKTEARKGRAIKWCEYRLKAENYKAGKWNTISFEYITPNFFHDDDKIKISFDYKGNQKVFLNNFKAEAWIPKKDY